MAENWEIAQKALDFFNATGVVRMGLGLYNGTKNVKVRMSHAG